MQTVVATHGDVVYDCGLAHCCAVARNSLKTSWSSMAQPLARFCFSCLRQSASCFHTTSGHKSCVVCPARSLRCILQGRRGSFMPCANLRSIVATLSLMCSEACRLLYIHDCDLCTSCLTWLAVKLYSGDLPVRSAAGADKTCGVSVTHSLGLASRRCHSRMMSSVAGRLRRIIMPVL